MSPTPGIVWVASQITKPAKLSEDRFSSWYEDQHIDEVVSLSGIRAAARYTAIPLDALAGPAPESSPAPSTDAAAEVPPYLLTAKWLTIYEMRDVEFRNTAEFKGLDGQTVPKDDLLETVFKNAKFQTRFGTQEQIDHPGSKPANLVISATLTAKDAETFAEMDKFYREEHVPLISKCPGYVRTRRYKYVDTTVLNEFERADAYPVGPMSWLALHEFEGPYFHMDEIVKVDDTDWTRKILANLAEGGMEAGFFRLKRVYGEFLEGGQTRL
jgi:hypothetical protein